MLHITREALKMLIDNATLRATAQAIAQYVQNQGQPSGPLRENTFLEEDQDEMRKEE